MPDVNAWPQGLFYSEQSLANQPATLRIETSVFPTALSFSGSVADSSAYAMPTAIAWHSAVSDAASAVNAGGVSIRLTAESATYLDVLAVFGEDQPASDSSEIVSLLSAHAVSGHRAVISDNGLARYADKDTPAHALLIAGITLQSATMGSAVQVQTQGIVVEPSWNWTPGSIWLGNNGLLTQTRPTAGLLWELGTAYNATTILWEPDMPISLA